ncbi:helix-turn-helix domain-containing protein [Trueperella pyogenes]|uniref:helix-turn-helix domain-containing protein n=1 Tax=Trueperella pyogenes TaxID=1661 RepID=UPI00345D0153
MDSLLTASEVSEMLPDTSEQSVYRWARQGKIPYIELPSGRKFFRRQDIEKLLTPTMAADHGDGDMTPSGQEMLL